MGNSDSTGKQDAGAVEEDNVNYKLSGAIRLIKNNVRQLE